MTCCVSRIIVAAAFLSHGLLAAAREVRPVGDGGRSGGLRRKQRGAASRRTRTRMNARNKENGDDGGDLMDEEDVAFWTRLLVSERGKETTLPGSLPPVPRPPTEATSVPRTAEPTPGRTPEPTPGQMPEPTPEPT
eukprot:CAMPEP_0172570038 /NCGR_PEP_ID=MMETSP1067-20121228/125958_1 /TAXON_ID=265564 ORGANISM="Thalassiosira punctigera, Strain Tpunct2005C2" /NCGR_SAMPLE_ID=MMETSP1067 /ASSEMBLY_ACC=CAM_ASM_000444 /LENGTH=135 /DNA_ID=CAMNT_0013362019 /DNA_START=9 /DNA_END=413 /DNA_ORIENTATION=+